MSAAKSSGADSNKTPKRKYTRINKTLEKQSDMKFLKRWKELGYDRQEREYYANPLVYAPTTASCLSRFANTGLSGAKLVLQAVSDVKIP